MASHQQPSPPSLPAPTTITALTDDLLREIFLRLPDLPSLVRAAFASRGFLRAVRSSPAFRRRFRELQTHAHAFVPAARRSSDPDIATVFDDLLRDDDASEWGADSQVPHSRGNFLFFNRSAEQYAFYNPHAVALGIFAEKGSNTVLEFHTLPPDKEDQRPSRVVCLHRDRDWAWVRVAVFTSRTQEWQTFPESWTPLLQSNRRTTRRDDSGFLFWLWVDNNECGIIALNTATFQFSRMDLPQPLRGSYPRSLNLGQTKDGRIYIVHAQKCTLSVWIWAADDDGMEKFMLYKMFPLHMILNKITKSSIEDNLHVGDLMTVIDGFVYLSVVYPTDWQSPEWFLSFCLETPEVNLIFKKMRRFGCPVDPYIMSWPPSLIHIKEDSKTQVTEDSAGDNGHVSTKEASPILFTALQSFKEALIHDGDTKFAEMDGFLLDEITSLQNRITTLDAGLAAARDRVLKNGAHSDIYREGMERESW